MNCLSALLGTLRTVPLSTIFAERRSLWTLWRVETIMETIFSLAETISWWVPLTLPLSLFDSFRIFGNFPIESFNRSCKLSQFRLQIMIESDPMNPNPSWIWDGSEMDRSWIRISSKYLDQRNWWLSVIIVRFVFRTQMWLDPGDLIQET